MSAQAEVLKAVCRGARTAKRIVERAGVDEKYVYVHLRRLRQKGKIQAVKVGALKEYRLRDSSCLLSSIWG